MSEPATPDGGQHAIAMDAMYRYQRHIYDLTRKYYLFGRDRMIAGLNPPEGGSLLEVACGTARNLKKASALYPQARLYGFDISSEMLISARRTFQHCTARPVLRTADACTFRPDEFAVDGFDRIMISYAVSMIPEWEKASENAIKALAPGGSLHIVDFGQQEGLPGWFKAGLNQWLAKFHVTPRSDFRQVLEMQADAAGAQLTFTSVGRGYASLAVIERQ